MSTAAGQTFQNTTAPVARVRFLYMLRRSPGADSDA